MKFSKSLVLIIFSLFLSNLSEAKTFCTKLSKSYKNKISKKFKQDPFFLVESFLKIPQNSNFDNTPSSQNKLLTHSFDLNRIQISIQKNLKSKAISKILFDWIRTQYFSSYDKNLSKKTEYLLEENRYLLTKKERLSITNSLRLSTGITQKSCSKEERLLLRCKSLYVITVQNTPAVSCKNKNLKQAFETKFYLTFSKKYGFKILDISLLGKRITLNSIKHMVSLKKKGFNKSAVASHISLLSNNPNTFQFPKKQVNTANFLATLQNKSPTRLPASL